MVKVASVARDQVDRREANDAVGGLRTIGANILDRRSTHAAGDAAQTLQPGQALVHGEGHQLVPDHPRANPDPVAAMVLGDVDAELVHRRDQPVEPLVRHDQIAPAAEHKGGQPPLPPVPDDLGNPRRIEPLHKEPGRTAHAHGRAGRQRHLLLHEREGLRSRGHEPNQRVLGGRRWHPTAELLTEANTCLERSHEKMDGCCTVERAALDGLRRARRGRPSRAVTELVRPRQLERSDGCGCRCADRCHPSPPRPPLCRGGAPLAGRRYRALAAHIAWRDLLPATGGLLPRCAPRRLLRPPGQGPKPVAEQRPRRPRRHGL